MKTTKETAYMYQKPAPVYWYRINRLDEETREALRQDFVARLETVFADLEAHTLDSPEASGCSWNKCKLLF